MKTSYKFNSSKDDIIVDIGICTCLMLKTLDLDYKELEAVYTIINFNTVLLSRLQEEYEPTKSIKNSRY
ncbi:unnamed protein product [Rhizophagus irregularis]|nr:unnamed protein product [Rhizophagus irregularis]